MRVEYHPETVADLNDAIAFYEGQRAGLGSEFREAIYHTIDSIVAEPRLYPPVRGQLRRCFVHRFPYSVIYRILDDDKVRILVIRHHRRHPQFGLSRNQYLIDK